MLSSTPLFGLLTLLGMSTIFAFELTLYDGVTQCSAESNTRYRIISDASDPNECHSIADLSVGVSNLAGCAEYTNGGNAGPDPCTSDIFSPRSIRVANNLSGKDHACEFYTEDGCPGASGSSVSGGCFDTTNEIKSFKCHWDDMDGQPDFSTEAGLACGSGVSGNVCHHDCECKCTGQNLHCAATNASTTCNDATMDNCLKYCICGNP